MCGIAGFKRFEPVDPGLLKRMVEALHHRGPDMDGYYTSGPFHAGMRRLIINDLKTGGQPLFNQDNSIGLLYNGEIYNSPDLRSDLQKKGYRFRTTCDGEVICHLYEEYQERLFEKLDGMFAVALWIEKDQKLILARDLPGEKPLYYSCLSDSEIVFASEIKSLKLFPRLDKTLNDQAIWDFPTFLWIPEPDTIFRDVKTLMPGHLLIADEKGIRIQKFANRFNGERIGDSDEDIIRATRTVVQDAVKSRLLSDVPLGCFLSGGLDSSIVTTIARRHLDHLDTFTIGFEDVEDPYHGRADESLIAERYAKQLGTKQHTISVRARTFKELLDTFCEYGDQPFSVSSGLGLLIIAKAAREAGIKVLLSGDGADEIFGGYSWYEHLPLETKQVSYAAVDEDISSQNYSMDLRERLNRMAQYKAHKRAWAWHYYASENEKQKLFSERISLKAKSSLRFFERFNPSQTWEVEEYVRQDRQFYLPNEMLTKMDRMTMAYSVEGRVPFVAPSVLSHADKLKYDHWVKDGSLKWVLRKAFEDILPRYILERPKHGFNVPIDHWLKNDWNHLIDEAFGKDSLLMKHDLIRKDSGAVAEAMVRNPDRLNGHAIFSLIMLNKWMQRCYP